MMAAQNESSYNPARPSSGKRDFPLASKVARELGLVPTWPNLQTIRLAIECEASFLSVPPADVAEMIVRAAKELTWGSSLACHSVVDEAFWMRLNTVNRFWFEDARWREKFAYAEFVQQLRREAVAC
jgi:hypothetical protein